MIQTLLFDFLYIPKTPLLFAIYQIKPGDCDVEEKDKWKKNAFLRVKANFISRQWKRTQLSNPVATWAFGWKEEIDQRLTSRAEEEKCQKKP